MLFPLAVATHQTELGKLGSHLSTFIVSQYPSNFSVVWDHVFRPSQDSKMAVFASSDVCY